MKHVTVVQCDNWEGLYVDSELKLQDHSIDIRDLIPYMPATLECIEGYSLWFQDYLEENDEMPPNCYKN